MHCFLSVTPLSLSLSLGLFSHSLTEKSTISGTAEMVMSKGNVTSKITPQGAYVGGDMRDEKISDEVLTYKSCY